MISKEEELVKLLRKKGLIISTAESCTGGLIAGTIINASGASYVYNEGFITYSNEAKKKYLCVKEETLKKNGAVSKETVEEMAIGCMKNTNSDIALVSSGIAGPDGGTDEKPVGLVYIACGYHEKVKAVKNIFTGDRQEVRQKAVACAIDLAIDMISE